MKVEKLTPSNKNPDRFYAEFEDGEKLTVNVALIADYSLYTGRVLDETEYTALKASAEVSLAKARALRILGKRNMSSRDITNRLIQKGESDETAQLTTDWLTKIGAVNDTEYAALIVRHYMLRQYGKRRICDELYRRGIDKELWEAALTELTETDDGAYDFLATKLKGGQPDKAELKRTTDAMYRRGFSWEDIKTALQRYNSAFGASRHIYDETEDFTDND